jgi:pyruvate kinase
MLKFPSHKTKIVCTIGPSSRSQPVLKKMIANGMNVARLNFSHGTLEGHREEIRRIRSLAAELNQVIAILADLPGPKIRIGKLKTEPLFLEKDKNVTLTKKNLIGTAALIPVNYKNLPESVSKGSTIYINDGFIQLRVQGVSKDEVYCKVIIGGQLLSYKGLNIPKARIDVEPVTARDLDLVDFGLKEGLDTFGLSFVEKAEDISKVKEFARKRNKSIRVVAKIERAEAVKNIEEIMNVADAIMVARGDLGVQIPIEEVPIVQKRIIRLANLSGRPVITATQMLESMTENIRPTRAEVADVANAILDGTDAVMLSEETAIGKYPAESVAMMSRIATSIERRWDNKRLSSDLMEYFRSNVGHDKANVEDAVSLNVIEAMKMLKVSLILTPTHTGDTPRRISRFKPDCWILSFSNNERTCKLLTFSYGVYPVLMKSKVDNWDSKIMKFIKDLRIVKTGDRVILTETTSSGSFGGTDSLRIIKVSREVRREEHGSPKISST